MTPRHGYIARSARRGPAWSALAVGACVAVAPAAGEALWESPTWGLTGALGAEYGYDSNLVARSEDISASYVSASPSLHLARRASLTRLEFTGTLEGTTFLSGEGRDSLDPSLQVELAHPIADGVDPERELEAGWSLRDVTNTDLGQRVRTEEFLLRSRVIVYDTGRTRFGAGVSGQSRSFEDPGLNTNQDIMVEGDVGYAVTPATHVGLGYAHEWGRSLGAAGRPDIHRAQDQVTLHARGRLLPKVSGSAQAGVAWIDYSGGIVRTDDTWVGGVSLDWDISPRTEATVRARRHADFAPEGQSVIRSSVEIEVVRTVGLAWRVRAGGGLSRLMQGEVSGSGEATAFTTMAGLGYQLTERFSAGVTHRYTQQDSWDPSLDYTRHQVEGQVHFRF